MTTYRFTLRVPYAHVDRMGFVYYAHYFVYFEMARTALLRDAGCPYSALEGRGILLPVLRADCAYKKPGHFEDLLAIDTTFTAWTGPRLRIDYRVSRIAEVGAGEAFLCSGYTEHVCMSPQGRVLRPPPELKTLVA